MMPHGVITKASNILNTKTDMKTYIKEMKDQEHQNNTKTYTISFFLKVAISMTLGSMKKDDGLFIWLRNNKIWIKAHTFTMESSDQILGCQFFGCWNAETSGTELATPPSLAMISLYTMSPTRMEII
jgi:hypothetical protein